MLRISNNGDVLRGCHVEPLQQWSVIDHLDLELFEKNRVGCSKCEASAHGGIVRANDSHSSLPIPNAIHLANLSSRFLANLQLLKHRSGYRLFRLIDFR